MPAAAVFSCDVCARGPALGWLLSAATTGTPVIPHPLIAAVITGCLTSCCDPTQLLPLVDSKSDELAEVRWPCIARDFTVPSS